MHLFSYTKDKKWSYKEIKKIQKNKQNLCGYEMAVLTGTSYISFIQDAFSLQPSAFRYRDKLPEGT